MSDTPPADMGAYLRAVCKEAREKAGVSVARVAIEHRPEIKQGQTIQQWEDGEIGWPRDPDDRVRVYAEVSGVPPWELWQMAIDLWRQSQEVPTSSRGSRRSAKVQTPQDTETRLDIEELRDKLNKRLGSGRSESPKASDQSPEDQAPKRDRQRPPRRRQASDSA